MQPASEDLGAAFSRLRQGLRGYLRQRVADPAQAEDLLQDVFVKALDSQRSGRRIHNLGGWLFAATRTTLADHYRAAGAPTAPLDPDLSRDDEDEVRMHAELATCLRAFVEQLPPLYRDTLIATEYEGRTMSELARSQGLSVSAIKSRAARGRALLREKLLACCYVEITGGLVSDYRKVKPAGGCGQCA